MSESVWTCDVCGVVIAYPPGIVQLVATTDHISTHTTVDLRKRLREAVVDRDEAIELLRGSVPLMPDEHKLAWWKRWWDLLGRHTPEDQ